MKMQIVASRSVKLIMREAKMAPLVTLKVLQKAAHFRRRRVLIH